MQNEVHIKISADGIEFDAKGDIDFIERERNAFEAKLLPLGVEAVTRTRNVVPMPSVVASENYDVLPDASSYQEEPNVGISVDWSRTSLAEFIAQKGATTHNDFILCAAYFDEKKNGVIDFSLENVKRNYEEARKKLSSNPSQYLNTLATKGYIVDSPEHKGEIPKVYRLSNTGLTYVTDIKPKEGKAKKVISKPRKPRAKTESIYAAINIDDLNRGNYPEIKSLKSPKEKMMMILYMITNERKGEWFTVADVACLMTDKFGESVNNQAIIDLFSKNKTWFKSENVEGSNKGKRHKLLNAGVDFAKKLLSATTQEG